MRILYYLSKLLPFLRVLIRIDWEKKSSLVVWDNTTFPECTSKVISLWSWSKFKTIKVVVHTKEGTIEHIRLD